MSFTLKGHGQGVWRTEHSQKIKGYEYWKFLKNILCISPQYFSMINNNASISIIHHLTISEIEMDDMETGEREPLLKRDSSSSAVGGASASAISLETEVGGASAAAAAKAFGGGHPGDTINFSGLLPGMQASGGYIPHQVQ